MLANLIDAWPPIGKGMLISRNMRRLDRVKLAVLSGSTLVIEACGGLFLANRWHDHAEVVGGVATFVGSLLFGLTWVLWPRPRIKLPRKRVRFLGRSAGTLAATRRARKGRAYMARLEMEPRR